MKEPSPPPSPVAPDRARTLADPATLREFARHLREGLYITDAEGRFLDASSTFLSMLGLGSVDELRTRTFDELVVDPAPRRDELALLDRPGLVREFELQLRHLDGRICTVLDTVYLREGAEAGQRVYHGVVLDVTKRVELEAQLRELSMRDPLTGCYNRRYLSALEEQLTRDDVASWGCIFVDLDHFKQYNDRWGHQRGDEVLQRMTRFLIRQVRADEAVVRLGGDEFLIVLVGADEPQTESVARRLQLAALRTAPAPFSLGWASRQPGESFEKTVNRADRELLAVRVVERGMERDRRGEE